MTTRIFEIARHLSRALARKLVLKQRPHNFDPVYYVTRYPDLRILESTDAARRHFEQHGRDEGRYPNAAAEAEALYHVYLNASGEFDLRAYKALNADLREVFQTDREYIIHYIRHGKAEGRPCTFADFETSVGDKVPEWAHRLSPSQFLAWASDWMKQPPASRREAIALFEAEGINHLAPLRFELIFDPDFYRRHYAPGSTLDDVALYRSWLDGGESRNEAPNEGQFLMPFIGQSQFPRAFDWRGYASAIGLSKRTDRAAVLARLFNIERSPQRARQFLSHDDWDLIEKLVRYRLNRDRVANADAFLLFWRHSSADWPSTLWILRGEIDRRLGNSQQARDAFIQAVRCGDRSFHPINQVAKLELASGTPERAVAWLCEHRNDWRGSGEFAQLATKCIDKWFEKLSATGHELLSGFEELPANAKQVTKFNAHMDSGLAAIAEAIEALEAEPAQLSPSPDGPVVLLGNEDLPQCTYYRIEQKQEQFARSGIDLRRHPAEQIDRFIGDLPGARATIFYRVPATPNIIRAILTARRMGLPTYYEIDDLLFEPEFYPAPYKTYQKRISVGDYNGLRYGVPLFRFALSLCDNAIASTPSLLKCMLPLTRNRRGLLVRNGLDSRNDATMKWASRLRSKEADRVRIFYGSGTLAHNADFIEIAVPALARLMAERDNVDIVLAGHVVVPDILANYGTRILHMPPVREINDYWSLLATCDINIAVLNVDPATDCKSEIKWLEAAALGIPSVVSSTATYQEIITPGSDGLIAESTEEWYRSLAALIDDAALRITIGGRARDKVKACYSLDAGAAAWRKEFPRPSSRSAPIQQRKIRVLVCNVFFAPQSIGGATRVVEDNVAHIAACHPDIEMAVLCTDHGATEGGRLRTFKFGDMPVFRLSVGNGRGGDAQIFNDENLDAFDKVVELFRPDIIHFHCIQRLTASLVQAAQDMDIPYLVTLHDAWWLSPHQFLVDEDGFLHMPSADTLAEFSGHRSTTVATIRRRRALDKLLLGAKRILAVSESFAEVYQAAGIGPISVIANGVSNLPRLKHRPPTDGPLRMAHIGGRASHKGADLVEAAMRIGSFPNVHLLMIDGHLPPGKRIETQWGQTPVTISAPVPQADIIELYADMDVLLAPSRWPESFGLVAREALHFGVWVVASRLGAMGEDVIDGQNGFLIDTSTRKDLDQVLNSIHEKPERFRRGMAAPIKRPRTSANQADELAALYREVAAITIM